MISSVNEKKSVNFTIRPSRFDDWPTVWGWTLEMHLPILGIESGIVGHRVQSYQQFVAVNEDDEPISYISFDVNGEDAYVSGYVTSPGHRGVGVGSALWAYMMGQLKYVTNIGIGFTCAEKDGVGKSLGKFFQNSVCRKTANCDFDKRSLKSLYLNFALIVTNGRWQDTVLLESALSSCGITNFVSSGLTDKAPNMMQMCRSDHNTAVFTFKSNQIQSYMNDTTCHTRNSNSSTFIDNLLSTCPNTLWIDEPDNPCKSSATYSAFRLHRLGPSNVTIADGTEEKDLLFGKTLIATSVLYSPFFNKAVDENGIVSYTGIIVEMMDKIASKLHFNYSLVEPYDGNAGILINGSWNGMIRMLQDKDVDIAAAPLTIGALRNTVVDFSSTFYFEDIGIMIKRPDERNTLWRMFSLFPNIMWGYILITAAFSTLVIYILHKFFPIPLNTGFESFNACGWYVFSCLSNQGGEQDPVTWSAVIFLTAFWLFVFAIISVYSGGLIAMLTTNRMALPFSNLQELAEAISRKEYKVCLQGNTQLHQTILKSDLNEYVTVRKFLSENHGFDTTEDNCVKLITNPKQNNLAFIAETTRLIEVQRQFCTNISFIILNERFFPGYFSFALQKNSPLNALISMEITDLLQYGLIDEWKRKYQEPIKFCRIAQPNDVISTKTKPLTVRAIGGPCLLFLVGLVLSATMFMWEYGIFHCCHRKTKLTVVEIKSAVHD